jgi:hypothetical protein
MSIFSPGIITLYSSHSFPKINSETGALNSHANLFFDKGFKMLLKTLSTHGSMADDILQAHVIVTQQKP